MNGLNDRIAAAFAEDATADAVRAVIDDVEHLRERAATDAAIARNVALDPSTPDVVAARRTMADAEFERDRLDEIAKRLIPRVREAAQREAAHKRRSDYERLSAERSTLVAQLNALHKPIIELARLVARIDRLDREVRAAGFASVRSVLADQPAQIEQLLSEVFVHDAFLALARRASGNGQA